MEEAKVKYGKNYGVRNPQALGQSLLEETKIDPKDRQRAGKVFDQLTIEQLKPIMKVLKIHGNTSKANLYQDEIKYEKILDYIIHNQNKIMNIPQKEDVRSEGSALHKTPTTPTKMRGVKDFNPKQQFADVLQDRQQEPLRKSNNRINDIKQLEKIFNDVRIQQQSPMFAGLLQEKNAGIITEHQFNLQAAEIIAQLMSQNARVRSVVGEILRQRIRGEEILPYGSSQHSENIEDTRVYYNKPFSGEETKYEAPRNRQQDGVSISSKQVGPHLGDNLDYHRQLEVFSERHRNDPRILEMANSIRSRMAQVQAYHDERGRDRTMNNQYSEDAPVSGHHTMSVVDIQNDPMYRQYVDDQIQSRDLTTEQQIVARNILFDSDPQALSDNLDYVQDMYSDFDVRSESAKSAPVILGKRFDKISIQGKNKIYNASDIGKFVSSVVGMISEVEGDIDPDEKYLKNIKKQTEVFTSHIVKRESTQYKIKNGSAFRTRACC